jgi:hypothetical protein
MRRCLRSTAPALGWKMRLSQAGEFRQHHILVSSEISCLLVGSCRIPLPPMNCRLFSLQFRQTFEVYRALSLVFMLCHLNDPARSAPNPAILFISSVPAATLRLTFPLAASPRAILALSVSRGPGCGPFRVQRTPDDHQPPNR